MIKMYRCKYCSLEFEDYHVLAAHSLWHIWRQKGYRPNVGRPSPLKGKKRPNLSITLSGKKKPYMTERNKINNPSKRPEVAEKIRIARIGRKLPNVSESLKKLYLNGFINPMKR